MAVESSDTLMQCLEVKKKWFDGLSVDLLSIDIPPDSLSHWFWRFCHITHMQWMLGIVWYNLSIEQAGWVINAINDKNVILITHPNTPNTFFPLNKCEKWVAIQIVSFWNCPNSSWHSNVVSYIDIDTSIRILSFYITLKRNSNRYSNPRLP